MFIRKLAISTSVLAMLALPAQALDEEIVIDKVAKVYYQSRVLPRGYKAITDDGWEIDLKFTKIYNESVLAKYRKDLVGKEVEITYVPHWIDGDMEPEYLFHKVLEE